MHYYMHTKLPTFTRWDKSEMKDILQYLAKSDSFTILSYTLKAEYTVTERLTINHGYNLYFK